MPLKLGRLGKRGYEKSETREVAGECPRVSSPAKGKGKVLPMD